MKICLMNQIFKGNIMFNFNIISYGSNSKGMLLLVYLEDQQVALDAGVKAKLPLDAPVLVTHEHQDHAKFVEYYLKKSMDVYMTPGTAKALGLKHYRLHTVQNGQTLQNGLAIRTIPTKHDAEEPCGFFISCQDIALTYITDTSEVPHIPEPTTHLIIECNYTDELLDKSFEEGITPEFLYKRIKKTHLSLSQLENYFKTNQLENIHSVFLVHMSEVRCDSKLVIETLKAILGVPVYAL